MSGGYKMVKIGGYKVLKQIGEGGFGRVYQAKHVILGEYACLKQNSVASEDHAQLLKYESKLLWKLDEHHSIPSVKDFYERSRESSIMVLSFIDGQTLEEIVEEKGPVHPEDVCWITERLLGALYYAHCNGVIHSDVKPQNVFVEPQKHDIKLIDWGIASYKPKKHSKPVGISPAYAAPELFEDKPPIPETDLYGTGLVMVRALGGDIARKSFRPDTPEPIVEFCQQLLRYDPLERPNWETRNPLQRLSDIRFEVFGRRNLSDRVGREMLKAVKGGGE